MKISVPENLGPIPVPEGIYKALISKADVKTTSTNKPMIVVEFTLQSAHPNSSEVTIGRKVFDNMVIQAENLWRTNITYKAACGEDLPKGDFEIDELIAIITSKLQGASVMVKVGVEMYEGQPQNRVKEVKKIQA